MIVTIETIKKKHKAISDKTAFSERIGALVGLAGISVKQRWFQASWNIPEKHFELINNELDFVIKEQITQLQNI